MAAPNSSTYRGWYYDRENGTLDLYFGEGGASDPVEVLRINASAITLLQTPTINSGDMELTDGTLAVNDGGTVTQATNKSTGVTLNTHTGQITMDGAALAAAAEVTFTVTNSVVEAQSIVLVHHGSAGTSGGYLVQCTAVAAGSFDVTVSNVSAGSLSEAIVLHFVVLHGAAS